MTADRRAQPSFPTRRSSDLKARPAPSSDMARGLSSGGPQTLPTSRGRRLATTWRRASRHVTLRRAQGKERSEEHTSELQSRRELVCRLLLEKKNEVKCGMLC